MNFLKKKLTKFAKKKVKEIVTAPRDQRNPHFQKLIDDTGDFLRFEIFLGLRFYNKIFIIANIHRET